MSARVDSGKQKRTLGGYNMAQITIDEKRCKRCEYCIAFCPSQVYGKEIDGLPRVEKQDQCTKCLLCVKRCPDFALKVEG